MHHIFVETDALDSSKKNLTVRGENFHHMIHVLRMKEGDEFSVSVQGDEGKEYRFGIEEIRDDEAFCILRFIKEQGSELPARVILLQGLPKSDKMEMIVQKTVELGISEIVPVAMKRCVVKLDDKKATSRVDRWNKIAESAAKQSKRGTIPQVTKVMEFKEALTYVKEASLKLIPYEMADMSAMEQTRKLIRSAISDNSKQVKTVAYIIGPEGGFTEEEVSAAAEVGFQTITLGGRILRTETAGLVVMSWLMYELE